MDVISKIYDERIKANNYLVEMSIDEYQLLVRNVMDQNEFQRKKVRAQKTVYALLRDDLLKGCVIPSIVLALTDNIDLDNNNADRVLNEKKDHLVILDGLQRSHSILNLINELIREEKQEELEQLLSRKLRLEIYIGLERLGILYRMLTLNTGQTPMSLRHQIEMLYLDYIESGVNDIKFVREVDGPLVLQPEQYNFKEVIEGFNAYLDRDESPIDKADVLENIASLKKLSNENQNQDLFTNYVESVNNFIAAVNQLCAGKEVQEQFITDQGGRVFGKNATQIFKKAQSLSGYGAAIGQLIDREVINDVEQITSLTDKLKLGGDAEDFLEIINSNLKLIAEKAKKIGNAHRAYFRLFYRELFNSDGDNYLNLIDSADEAFNKYNKEY